MNPFDLPGKFHHLHGSEFSEEIILSQGRMKADPENEILSIPIIIKQLFHCYLKEIQGQFDHNDDNAIKILSNYLNRLFI